MKASFVRQFNVKLVVKFSPAYVQRGDVGLVEKFKVLTLIRIPIKVFKELNVDRGPILRVRGVKINLDSHYVLYAMGFLLQM